MKGQAAKLSAAGHQWNRLSRWEQTSLDHRSLPHRGYCTGSPCKLLLCVPWELLPLFRHAPHAFGTLGMGSDHVPRNMQPGIRNCSWPKAGGAGTAETKGGWPSCKHRAANRLYYIGVCFSCLRLAFLSFYIIYNEIWKNTDIANMEKADERQSVFSKRDVFLRHHQGGVVEVGGMRLCQFLQEGHILLSVC